MRGESITETGLSKEATDAAAERLKDLEAPYAARIRKIRWRLVACV